MAETSERKVSEEDLDICKIIIPPQQFLFTVEQLSSEEGKFYEDLLKSIANTYRSIRGYEGLANEDGTHNVAFHYFFGSSDFFVSEIDSNGIVFGYTVLNGDVEMSEWGYSDIKEILGIDGMEMNYYIPEGATIESMLYDKYPDYFLKYKPSKET